MFWELIATFSVGILAAGSALILRHFLGKKLGKATVIAAAGTGMLGYQIYWEYHWFSHTSARLPAQTAVVAQFSSANFYQPWTYFKAPIHRFVAVDFNSLRSLQEGQKEALFYFFERRQPAQFIRVRIDCQRGILQPEIQGTALWVAQLCRS